MTVPQLRGEMRHDEPMSRHVSWRAGGNAKNYYIPADLDDLSRLLASLPDNEDILWVGLGSNTLVREAGYDGTVIALQGVLNELQRLDDNCVYAGAGVTGAKLARFCAKEHLLGAEFFAGIPGLVGGALAMNAGAFGGETWRHVISVETIDRNGDRHKRNADEYQVGYRSVIGPADEWFTAATFRFETGDGSAASADIKQLLARRAESQPMGAASCGSVFTNPEHDHAARLIEASGLKGYRIGGAVVSEKHANFIINDNNASADDIESLITHIQRTVLEQQGVELHTEVRIVGEKA
ncbi:MAG: UDP-N-acetylmuramate dehydrogenase [Thiotrichales bacterium]|nr:MAG: UDP-N-acetylmuramate dehydrogenase [Thiotrichales bacterium]